MAQTTLLGCRVAILATDGFEQDELLKPREALEEAGADVRILSLKSGSIKSWKKDDWGKSIAVDNIVREVTIDDFDALMIPGGVINPDKLRNDDDTVKFVSDFAAAGKPIAAICHGPQVLISANVVEGRNITSWPSLKTDLLNAGANWIDDEVVVDLGLVTSRKPDDIPAFNEKMIAEFAEGPHDPKLRVKQTEAERNFRETHH